MLTRQKLTTDAGYVKYSSRERARQIARKMDLSGTHAHQINEMTIYMPGRNHRSLNAALRARGLPETSMPSGGMGDGMAMMPDEPAETDGMLPDLANEDDLGMGVDEGTAEDMLGDGLLDDDQEVDVSFSGDGEDGDDTGLFDNLFSGTSHNSDDDDSGGGIYG